MSNDKKTARSAFRRVGSAINPLSPLKSIKNNVGKSYQLFQDVHTEAAKRAKNPIVRTWDEAWARRPSDAMSLDDILSQTLLRKRIALFFALITFVFSTTRLVTDLSLLTFIVTVPAILSVFLFLLIAVKYACRRRLNIDPPCRLKFDPGLFAAFEAGICG
ncbi:MAG: hypothetical protein H6R01_903 [Burkholderiaceae bacterium]|nr:hypothetical protein [Burkholderiaceae bacterium]